MTESVFVMLIKNNFVKWELVKGYILFFILIKVEIYKIGLKPQNFSAKEDILIFIILLVACCRFHAKQSRSVLTLILVHIFLWVKDWTGT